MNEWKKERKKERNKERKVMMRANAKLIIIKIIVL